MELEKIIARCLRKDPERRAQGIADIKLALEELKEESESGKLSGQVAATAAVRPLAQSSRRLVAMTAGVVALVVAAVGLAWWLLKRPSSVPARLNYTQITNFTDSAVCPALSPDGRMLAFIRSEYTFGGPGQIYVKLLPDGDPVQLMHDDLDKRGSPKFSPAGTRLAYAALKAGSGWDTWVVPVLGGQPRLFLANASGLTWIEDGPGQSRLLFSELTGLGNQMAIVS